MKLSEFNKIMNRLNFPERFIKIGRLVYTTINHETGAKILVGFYLDSSIDKNSFFVQYFVQCLYVPFGTYNFSLGDRIGNYWGIDDVDYLNNELKRFGKFYSLNSFEDFIPYLENNIFYGNEIGRTQYFAFTYFIQKDFVRSLLYLNEIINLKSHSNSEWFKEEILSAEFMKNCIEKHNYNDGLEQLIKWQLHTMKSLKLKV